MRYLGASWRQFVAILLLLIVGCGKHQTAVTESKALESELIARELASLLRESPERSFSVLRDFYKSYAPPSELRRRVESWYGVTKIETNPWDILVEMKTADGRSIADHPELAFEQGVEPTIVVSQGDFHDSIPLRGVSTHAAYAFFFGE